MNDGYQFMGIDLGTTAVKCVIIGATGTILAKSRKTYERLYPKEHYIEQRPEDWWKAVIWVVKQCLSQLEDQSIHGISFSGHMSAPVFMDQNNQVIYPAILIADTRSVAQTKFLTQQYASKLKKLSGNEPIDAFTLPKLLWFKEKEPDLYQKVKTFVFPKDYIRYKLTGFLGTDPTDAGNSMVFDYHQKIWDVELIKELGLKEDIFPKIYPSTELFGYVTKESAQITGLKEGTPVMTGAADMACSQIGCGVFKDSDLAITLSTSIQVVRPVVGFHQELDQKMTYHLSGDKGKLYTMASIFSGGLSIDWAYSFLFGQEHLANEDYIRIEKQTKNSKYYQEACKNLIFLPFLSGSGSPYFCSSDSGGWLGFRNTTDKMALMVSVFEGITYNIKDNYRILENSLGPCESIKIAGGGSRYSIWPQIIADVLQKPVEVLRHKDVSGLGAGILAGVGVNVFENLQESFEKLNQVEEVVYPRKHLRDSYQGGYETYKRIYLAMRGIDQ